eukprot:5420646-Amphidinium_carterae.1
MLVWNHFDTTTVVVWAVKLKHAVAVKCWRPRKMDTKTTDGKQRSKLAIYVPKRVGPGGGASNHFSIQS